MLLPPAMALIPLSVFFFVFFLNALFFFRFSFRPNLSPYRFFFLVLRGRWGPFLWFGLT